jgi:hypothetical protein
MTVNTKTFNSEGGFGVKQTSVISDNFDIQNINSFELQNVNYSDAKRLDLILKAINTAILSKRTNVNDYIILNINTINFITANIIGVNQTGSGVYSQKIETIVKCNGTGDVSTLSSLKTTIRDDVPNGQSWGITNYDTGNAGEFSFNVRADGATDVVKWIGHIQLISVSW